MKAINSLLEFISMNEIVISGIAGLCGILGFLGSILFGVVNFFTRKRLKKAENQIRISAKKIEDFEVRIKEVKAENAQIAKTIYNYGLSYEDTKNVAEDVFEDKASKKPNFSIIHENGEKEYPKEFSFIVSGKKNEYPQNDE